MDLSIIIINFNTNQLTIDCLKSIYAETKTTSFEIILIDNHSTKENPDQIKYLFPEIILVKNKENVGFGRANNQGIAMAKGKHTLLLNSDTLILGEALDKCVAFMNSDFAVANNIGLMGCNLLNKDRSHQASTFKQSNIWGYFINSNPILRKIFNNATTNLFDSTRILQRS